MPKRILIAEDDVNALEALVELATLKGYEVVGVPDGLGYLSAISKQNFDLVITDLLMPDLNGAAATEIMKMQGDPIPVIAITALSQDKIVLLTNKFAKIYRKPVDSEELFDHVEALLQG